MFYVKRNQMRFLPGIITHIHKPHVTFFQVDLSICFIVFLDQKTIRFLVDSFVSP